MEHVIETLVPMLAGTALGALFMMSAARKIQRHAANAGYSAAVMEIAWRVWGERQNQGDAWQIMYLLSSRPDFDALARHKALRGLDMDMPNSPEGI